MFKCDWSHHRSSCTSGCQHFVSEARLPLLWCSGGLFQSWSPSLWSPSGQGLGGWSRSCWSTFGWKYCCHGDHQSWQSLWKCILTSTLGEGWLIALKRTTTCSVFLANLRILVLMCVWIKVIRACYVSYTTSLVIRFRLPTNTPVRRFIMWFEIKILTKR